MKKLTILFIVLLIFTLTLISSMLSWAQAPQKMSYQAVIRNSSDKLIVNQKVGMKISILKGSDSGTSVYTETQKPTTNANGLVTVEIGTGTTSDDFSSIDWANGQYYIKTATDPTGGTNYTIIGASQLLSVPYALYAQTAGKTIAHDGDTDSTNEIQTLSISGTSLSLSKGGGTVTLPSSGGGDNWGTQTAVTNATLEGNGTTATPLKIAQQGATNGQVLKWNGTTWKPGNVDQDSTNEIQKLSISGSNLTLSKGGGTVALPSSAGGLTLPYNDSANYSVVPFSLNNNGSAWYTIRGTSTNGYGIYGKTK